MAAPPARVTRVARPSTTMRRVNHAPLGRCLYCLASGVPLTEEHLIPRVLGGRLTLRDAVCEPCRRLTGQPEQTTLDREFLVPKTLLALKRRRARGQGPSRLPAVLLAGEDAPSTLTADIFPRGFALPVFGRAGLLEGFSGTGIPPRIDFIDCTLNLGTPRRHAIAATAPLIDPKAYAWSIAKWAYALAVGERGLDGFDTQPMRDLMSGRRDDAFSFVGTASPRRWGSGEWLHEVSLHEDGPWLAVTLALFASTGMAAYEVVVGRMLANA